MKPAKDKNKDRKKSSSPVGTKTENLKLQEKDLNTLQLQGIVIKFRFRLIFRCLFLVAFSLVMVEGWHLAQR